MNNDHDHDHDTSNDRLQALWAEAMKPVRMKAGDLYGDLVRWIVAHLPKSAQHWIAHKCRIYSISVLATTGKRRCPICKKEYM